MKCLSIVLLFFVCPFLNGQQTDSIKTTSFVKSFALNADEFIGVDEFDNVYYLKNNTFYKKNKKEEFSFSNTQLGKISSVDIKNPLKILLFFKDFNRVILLDNKLNELSNQIDFDTTLFSKNISMVSGSSTNNLWVYSLDDNKLYVYNYKTNKVVAISAPLNFREDGFKPNRMFANYKNCWLMSENVILEYDEYSNFKQRLIFNEISLLNWFNDNYYWVKEGVLYQSNLKDGVFSFQFENSITIKSFYVLNDEIYIFDGGKIFVFKTVKF